MSDVSHVTEMILANDNTKQQLEKAVDSGSRAAVQYIVVKQTNKIEININISFYIKEIVDTILSFFKKDNTLPASAT